MSEDVKACPAGAFEADETDLLIVAKMELLQETGYKSFDWTDHGYSWESTSKLTNRMHLFLAKNCVMVAEQCLDENEHLDVVNVSLGKAVEMIKEGIIKGNSTVHLILKVARMIGV